MALTGPLQQIQLVCLTSRECHSQDGNAKGACSAIPRANALYEWRQLHTAECVFECQSEYTDPASRLLCPLVDDGAPPAHSACREEAPFTYSPQVPRFARPGAAAEGAAARAAAPSEAKVQARVEASAGSSGAASAGLAAVNGASGTAAATEPVSSAPPSRVAGASSSSHSLRSGDRHDSPPRALPVAETATAGGPGIARVSIPVCQRWNVPPGAAAASGTARVWKAPGLAGRAQKQPGTGEGGIEEAEAEARAAAPSEAEVDADAEAEAGTEEEEAAEAEVDAEAAETEVATAEAEDARTEARR